MTSPQLAGRVADYYRRNRTFLTPFEPMREDAFFSEAGQRPLLLEEQRDVLSDRGYRFYIARRETPEEIIGLTSLGQIVRRAFQSCFLGYKLDQRFLRRGYMTEAVRETVRIAFEELDLHRIEANIMPRNLASLGVARKAGFYEEGLALKYLQINGVWEDHIHRLNCNKSTGKYLRCYQVESDTCMHCPKRPNCFDKAGIRRRVLASSCYPAFYRGHQRVGTPEYLSMMRLRKIWAEGSFSVLKREHCISKIRKRGILAATEECLLAAMALNLKRMANAIFFISIFTILPIPLRVSAEFLPLSTGPELCAN